MTEGNKKPDRRLTLLLLFLTALNCAFQIAWFWRFRAHNITMDGVNYIGLARHLRDGNLTASLHGYWSPFLSWLIAAGSFVMRDPIVLARVITIASFLSCLPLLYGLTFRLWHSHQASAAAVLWFSLARGVIAGAVTTIQADFLFTAFTSVYCTLLIACLRNGTSLNWFLLGTAHAVAFLTKAFAMPWLGLATVIAVLSKPEKSLPSRATTLLLALLVPAITWVTWGEVLKTKYGVFTTGYQLKANLQTDLKRKLSHYERGDPYAFVDAPYDNYMVAERWATVRDFDMSNPALGRVILENELRNIPAALKELVILLTPGGVLGLIVGIPLLIRHRFSHRAEAAFAGISIVSMVSLVTAYGMLVFDARYVLPITAIFIALASGFIFSRDKYHGELSLSPTVQKICIALLIVSILFFSIYWASPFRTVDRDFQRGCYDAAAVLKRDQPDGDTLVSIGNGPYPDHGVGFEAGTYVAYFSGRRLIAMNSALPGPEQISPFATAVLGKQADAVLVWGKPANRSYQTIVAELRTAPGAEMDQAITDPAMGEVGRVILFSRR